VFVGYNTNGFAHHRLADAVGILAELGYGGVALTPDVHHLDPANTTPAALADTAALLREHGLRCVIESGARFVLDPRRKHQPTLLSPDPADRARRLAFLETCIGYAAALGADAVSFWSGTPTDDPGSAELMRRLADGCRQLADTAAAAGVRLAFEPEPGMFVDTMGRFADLSAAVNHPMFGLTVDVGHLLCTGELPVSRVLTDWKHVLWNVHVEDMRRGVHDHLMFGEGDVDFADVFAGLRAAGYAGGVYVELSRHSHDAVNTARRSKAFLERWLTAD
jgi:sugar phosphate isomerase/epimerase